MAMIDYFILYHRIELSICKNRSLMSGSFRLMDVSFRLMRFSQCLMSKPKVNQPAITIPLQGRRVKNLEEK